jgi:hypothetical protein
MTENIQPADTVDDVEGAGPEPATAADDGEGAPGAGLAGAAAEEDMEGRDEDVEGHLGPG